MESPSSRVVHQSFLPESSRAHVWKYSLEFGGRRPRHFHAEPELNLVVRGSAVFGVGNQVVRVSAGELIGFPAGQDHVLIETTPDVYLYAIGMAPELASEVLRGNIEFATLPRRARLPEGELQSITQRASDAVDRFGVEQQCAELWEQLHGWGRGGAAHGARASARTMHVLTRRAVAGLAEDPSLGLEALANKLRSSPSEVSRYFHRDMGLTFAHYRKRQRLLRFIGLARQGQGNWLAAALEAGFGSYSQCHRSFQADLGCSPRQYFAAGGQEEMQRLYDD